MKWIVSIELNGEVSMAVFLVPFLAVVIGGALVAGAGVGVIEARRSKAANAAELENAEKKASELFVGVKAHLASGALYPAFREYRKYIDHVESYFDISPEQKRTNQETYNDLRGAALSEYRKLHSDYQKEAAVAYDDGEEPFKAQADYIAKLEKLLGPGAPKLKAPETSFGASYTVYKYGLTPN
ncbi:hypothetical protein ACI77I_10400 [Pseudomonas sp. D47]|uniref:hypothetical protein n=1 Tax=Pseudomonas sp. D47 TaxID=3159447 RepID=UPI00387B3B7D